MSKTADDDFRELELYLEQAKEDIGQAIFSQTNATFEADRASTPTHNNTDHDLQDRQSGESAELKDILCHYDNMEFFGPSNDDQKNNNQNTSQKADLKSKSTQHKTSSTSNNLDQNTVQKADLKSKSKRKSKSTEYKASSTGNHLHEQHDKAKQLKPDISKEKSNLNRIHPSNSPGNQGSIEKCSHSPGNQGSIEKYSHSPGNQGSIEKSSYRDGMECCRKNTSLVMDCEDRGLSGSSTARETDKKHVTDDLRNYNKAIISSNNRLPDRMANSETLLQTVPGNLGMDSSLIGHGSHVKGKQSKSPVKRGDTQIDENLGTAGTTAGSAVPQLSPISVSPCISDKSKLACVSDGEKAGLNDCKTMQTQSQRESMDVKFEISNLIEKINESIDELIGGGQDGDSQKEKVKDSQTHLKDTEVRNETIVSSSSSESHSVNKNKNEIVNRNNDEIEIENKSECSQVAVTVDNCDKTGEDVVETDFGFYWVTSSIDEQVNIHNMQKSTESLSSQKDMQRQQSNIDKTPDNLDTSNGQLSAVEAPDKLETSNGQLSAVEAPDNLDTSHGQLSEVEAITDTSLNDSMEFSDDTSKTKSLTKSTPNFLSLDRTTLKKHRISRQDNDQSASDENLARRLKRKYSAPPSFCRVYKVVSVDIPKMDYSKSLKRRPRFGDASKKCSSTVTRFSSEECVSGRKEENLDSVLKKDKNRFIKDISGSENKESDAKIKPPLMFQDSVDKKEDIVDIPTGPILKPPPAFASNDEMDSTAASEPPLVWDPGVGMAETKNEPHHKDPSTLHSQDKTTPSTALSPLTPPLTPLTPPLPSADSTERLISCTLSQHKQHKVTRESNLVPKVPGNLIPKAPGSPRPRSADSGLSNRCKYDLNGNERGQESDKTIFRKSDSNQIFETMEDHRIAFTKSDILSNGNVANCIKTSKVLNSQSETVPCKNKQDNLNIQTRNDMSDHCKHKGNIVKNISKRNNKMITDGKMQKPCVSMGTNTTDSLDRKSVHKITKPKAATDVNVCANMNQSAESESSPVYAQINKSASKKCSGQLLEPSKTNSTSPGPNIPDKPKDLPGELHEKNTMNTFEDDHSPEFQVMFNSLSPVLLRRKPSKSGRKAAGSVETSPDSTPSVSPRLDNIDRSKLTSTVNQEPKEPTKSLFMDPAMAQTWHGATSSNWSNIFGPQLRAMMKDLEKEGQLSQDSINRSEEILEQNSKTLPSKSLLDEMHKRVCADQYLNSRDAEVARALVLLRLKSPSSTPAKPRRSQSFNIRMGTGRGAAAGMSVSSDSSPMLPRVSERIRIKTRPDFQYSPKPRRAITPEPTVSYQKEQNSRKEEAEIEAIEACRWLRETGFPQYAQLYEDGQFPVDIESVEKDHDFLDKEDIQSLFRRLNTLNKCAIMKIGTPTKKETEDSDEEDQCALSDKWKYQRSSRRWSRKDLDSPLIETTNGQPGLKSASSHDSLLADQNSSSETGDSPVLDSKMHHLNDNMVINKSAALDANGNATTGLSPKVFHRAASERIKGAKSFLKRMESLKGKRSKKPKTITEISGPVVADKADMQAKIKHLNCRDLDISAPTGNVSGAVPSMNTTGGDSELNGSSISANSRSREPASSHTEALTVTVPERRNGSAMSASTTSSTQDSSVDMSAVLSNGAHGLDMSTVSQHSSSSDTTNSSDETFFTSEYRPGRFPKNLDDSLFLDDSNIRHRSHSYTDENSKLESKISRRGSHDPRHQMHRISIYDNVPIEEDLTVAQQELDIILSELFQNINGLNKAINGEDAELLEPPVSGIFDDTSLSVDSHTPENEPNTDAQSDITHEADENEVLSATLSSPDISDHELPHEETSHDDSAEHIVCRERRDSGVGSSLTRTNSDRRKYRIRWHSFQKSHRPTSENRNLQLCNLSAGQILLLRKLSLLKLTALIEKYSPNRTGWSLTVPRFMKRHKAPDYKDKNVFGVPFSVMIQRTGQALPQCILHAMRFLRRTAGDALGIFRKSGVRSRIQKLRNEIEANPESMDFDELQAYDVADLVKQYFRELPECLLTNKLSDMFISIFIYVPVEYRLEALQAAVVLMADENRNVLQSLLLFLSDIAKQHNKHQMTASNLAVCFAPSLFMGSTRNPSSTPSPRRNRKNAGIPDARELMEQKAAHECLTVMIQECKKIFTIPAITLSKCRVWHGDPLSLEELSSPVDGNQGYTAYIDSCIQGLLKESREKFRGWVSVPVHLNVDVSYKKVGDGHPLRLYKCTVDVEAPPTEVLNRVLKDRQTWDEDLLQWHTVEALDSQTEVFQYVRNSMAPHPTRDYCVLRSWRSDLPKGACVLISMSIEHPNAELNGGLTAVELASRYLIEPCGTGKSRLTHISRVDLKGHSPDWYKKVYGHLCANFVDKIRASFQCNTEGPETKV